MKRFKKILSIILCIMLISSISACAGSAESPDKEVKNLLDALKAYDKEALKKYSYIIKSDTKGIDKLSSVDQKKIDEMAKKIFSNLTYEIISTDEKDNTATVKVKITNKDFGTGVKTLITEFMGYAFSNPDASDSETEEYFIKRISSIIDETVKKSTTVTNEVTLTLNKKDNKWIIKDNDALGNAILGGAVNSVEEVVKGFGDMFK